MEDTRSLFRPLCGLRLREPSGAEWRGNRTRTSSESAGLVNISGIDGGSVLNGRVPRIHRASDSQL